MKKNFKNSFHQHIMSRLFREQYHMLRKAIYFTTCFKSQQHINSLKDKISKPWLLVFNWDERESSAIKTWLVGWSSVNDRFWQKDAWHSLQIYFVGILRKEILSWAGVVPQKLEKLLFYIKHQPSSPILPPEYLPCCLTWSGVITLDNTLS